MKTVKEGRKGGSENPHESHLKDVNCRKKWVSEATLRRFQHSLYPRTAGAVCVADADGSASRSRDLTPAIPAFSLPPLPWLSPGIFRNLPTTFCPKHNAKKCCCLGIFLTPEKAGKEIQIKIMRQEESSLKRIADSACAEGAFDVLCLCATHVFA